MMMYQQNACTYVLMPLHFFSLLWHTFPWDEEVDLSILRSLLTLERCAYSDQLSKGSSINEVKVLGEVKDFVTIVVP